jgi:dTDP-4-amino-4,6-dideoxygalactose transaminase
VVTLGFNYRLDEPRAALARRRLARLDDENRRRADLDRRYREELGSIDGLTAALEPQPGGRQSHHLFTVVLDASLDRARFRRELATRVVQTSLHYPPVHRFAIYADGAPELPHTEAYGLRAVTLPLFATMTDAQQRTVLDSVRSALELAVVS